MYVCICNGIKDKDLARAVQAGSCCTASAYSYLGSTPQCGQCLETAEALITELSADQQRPPKGHSADSLCSCT